VSARLLLLLGALLASGGCKSDPLSVEPWVGLITEYASNPYLQVTGPVSESDVAILLNSPVKYDLDAAHFALTPRIRYSDSGTYASIASNYFHLDGSAQYQTDLDSLTLTGGVGRDSSLYYNGLSSNGVGVRTDSEQLATDWQRVITPRSTFELNLGWSRVQYDQGAESSGLSNYRYFSGGPSLTYALSERDTLSATSSAGFYKTLDGVTESKSYNLQLGFSRQLTEIWTLSTSAGYSRSDNSANVYFGPFLLGTEESEQNGPVYKATLIRKGELVDLTATASRAYIPSGFAFLSRQDIAQFGMHYNYSERWSFTASGTYQREQDPASSGAFATRSYFSAAGSANWKWTPNWLLTLNLIKVNENYESLGLKAASSGVSFEISRQFLRIDI